MEAAVSCAPAWFVRLIADPPRSEEEDPDEYPFPLTLKSPKRGLSPAAQSPNGPPAQPAPVPNGSS